MSKYKKTFVICDRCVTEFEEKPGDCLIMWMQFQSFNNEYGIFTNGRKIYNLCEKCEREFIDWFMLKNKKEM